MRKIAVLSVQGAFIEHETMLKKLGVECVELRQKADLNQSFDGLVLPGGESTVQGKLLKDQDMFDILQKRIQDGIPVLATCAGLILLAENLSNDEKTWFQTLPVTVRRNAYGRQTGSFFAEEMMEGIGRFPMEFIRAPYIENVSDNTKILAKVDGNIVAVRYRNQLGTAFHPELGNDTRVHEEFLKM